MIIDKTIVQNTAPETPNVLWLDSNENKLKYSTNGDWIDLSEGASPIEGGTGTNSVQQKGTGAVALGDDSFAEGTGTKTSNSSEHAQGKYNVSNTGETDAAKTIHSIGIGTADNARANAVEAMTNGDVYIKGVGGYDGTNPTTANTKDIADVISNIEEKVGTGTLYDTSILDEGEEQYAYGVLIDFTQGKSSYDLTRIGNMELHRTLPVQSQYKGCIWDLENEEIVTYLNPENWNLAYGDYTAEQIAVLMASTTKSIRVETPKFYACSKVLATDGAGNTTMAKVMFSTQKLSPLYIEIPKMVTDFRDVRMNVDGYPTACLADDDIYGGYCTTKNSSSTGKSGLLHPITNIDRATMRDAANSCNTYLFCYEYYKWIFYWAFAIEYATLWSAKPMNNQLDENGFHQGGLGPGMTSIESYGLQDAEGNYVYDGDYNIQAYIFQNANYFQSNDTDEFPLRDVGVTNSLGNSTGEITQEYEGNTGTSLIHQNRYRGFEFPFGDILMNLDGVLCGNRNGIDYYLSCKNPEHFADDIASSLWYDSETSEDWRLAGRIQKEFNSDDSYYQYPLTFGGYDESGQTMYANIGNEGDLIPQALVQPSDGMPRNFVNQFYLIDSDNNIDSPCTLQVGCHASTYEVPYVGLGRFSADLGVDSAYGPLGFRCFNILND